MGDEGELVEAVTADPSRVRVLRRAVRAFTEQSRAEDIAVLAELLVSELLANVVLHAGGDGDLHARLVDGGVRVEVHDRSRVLPSRRTAGSEAITGRGLTLLDSLAGSWGAKRTERGKVVWFEVGTQATAGHVIEPHGDVPTVPVRFVDVPIDLLRAAIDYGDAVLREMSWLAMDTESGIPVPALTGAPALDLGALLSAIEDAAARGSSVETIECAFEPEAGPGAIERLAMVDEADRLAADGALLSLPAVPEIGACRRWLLSEIARQIAGHEPTPWNLQIVDVDATGLVPATGDERARIDDAHAVLADTANRIVHVAPDIAAILGWEAGDLRGRRLAELIPQRYREAHLTGFTRFQLGGEPAIMGQVLELPARRRDGSEVVLTFTIEVVRREDGARAYQATFEV